MRVAHPGSSPDFGASTRLAKLLQALSARGLRETVALVKKNLAHELRWHLDTAFDRKHGTRTSGIVELNGLGIGSDNVRYGVYYEPTPTKVFLRIVNALGVRHEDFAFYDFGSGMGRTLLLASSFPFREIVGIEFSEILHRQAVENIAIYRSRAQRCSYIRSICLDATQFDLPKHDSVLFFYNPFEGPVMREVLTSIQQSYAAHPRKVVLIYYNPQWAHLIDEIGFPPNKRSLALPYDFSRSIQRKVVIYSN